MRVSEGWVDMVQEEYFIYLDSVDEDSVPMSYESYEWLKVREREQEGAELYEGHYESV